MKFTVHGTATIYVSIVVEAENENDAIDVAYDEFGGIRGYAGNGGRDKLVGVAESNVSIEPGDEYEFTGAEKEDSDS